MILTTTNTLEGFKIIKYKGIVSGIGVNLQKQTLSFSIKKYNLAIAEGMELAKDLAFKNLEKNANDLHVGAVVGIKVDIELTASNFVIVSITGTAVNFA